MRCRREWPVAIRSAGLLLWRRAPELQVLLAHPGGPFFARKDDVWTLPKGELDGDEVAYDAARREFAEELGSEPPGGPSISLGEVVLRSGKVVLAWAVEGDLDVATVVSNTCTIAWPHRSGRTLEIPEIDRAEWFDLTTAAQKLAPAQRPFLDRLAAVIMSRE